MPELPKYPHDLLPMPQQQGYGFTPVNPILRTQMQSGRSKQRSRYRGTPTNASIMWRFFEKGQAQLFESWYLDVINDGASWFEMTLQTPQGVMPYTCRFTEIYDGPTLIPPCYWEFTGTLELRKRPVTGDGWALYYPEALRYGNIIDVAINREWPEP